MSLDPHPPEYGTKIDLAPRLSTQGEVLAQSGRSQALTRAQDAKRSSAMKPAQVLILGFAAIIALGTLLLKLPWSAAPGQTISWMDAFFTATSATTVTGLAVRTTATDFSFFGQVMILLLLQVGGVGFISFSVLLFRIIGRRLTLQNRFMVRDSLGVSESSGVLNLALYVLGITLGLEAIGAAALWLRWRTVMPDGLAAWMAIFHAISSYCNAGFDLFSGTLSASEVGPLFGFGADWWTLAIMGTLILLGGFGITVMYDLWSFRLDRRLSLHTKLTLILTATLTLVGIAIMMLDGNLYSKVLTTLRLDQQFAVSFFTTDAAAYHLDFDNSHCKPRAGYTIFGECGPIDLVHKIASVKMKSREQPEKPPVIKKVTITRKAAPPAASASASAGASAAPTSTAAATAAPTSSPSGAPTSKPAPTATPK